MKRLLSLCSLWLVLLPASVFAKEIVTGNYIKAKDGIIVKPAVQYPGSAHAIKLKVVSANIIRVVASPVDSILNEISLIVTPTNNTDIKWNVVKEGEIVTLSTDCIHASVSLQTGEILFTDKQNNILLQEPFGSGKTFQPIVIDGTQSYILQQKFVGQPNEALYGLGQHQAGVFNYKGTQVLLSQYNTEVAVPFLISSNNYGILWDNNSITKAVDIRNYLPLSAFKLFSKAGDQGWLTATYFNKYNKSKAVVSRPESEIEYSYIPSLKNLPDGVKLDSSLVEWEGDIESAFTGEHVFNLKFSGYVKLYLDNKLVINAWRQNWNPGTELIKFNFEKNKKTHLKIEWDPTTKESYLACSWLQPKNEEDKNGFGFESEAGNQIDYYFIKGNNCDEVISGYRQLTGKATLLPKWAMGLWQSRERYKTQDEILSTVAEFRKRRIPLDNIVEDWSYWEEDKWGSQEFDKSRFPNAKDMIDLLHNKYHTHFMISAWAKFYEGIPNYTLLNDSGWIYKRNVANRQKDWIGNGYVSSFYDAYNPSARKAFWNMLNKTLYTSGVDAWWLDATEPDVTSNLSPQQRKEFSGPNFYGSSTKFYNNFALMQARAVYEGQRSTNPADRVFILTRSAYAGMQKYAAATWSGDVASRWEDLKNQIPAGINFSLSGMPYWTTDIGGFAVEPHYEKPNAKDLEEWRELMTRWYQFGTFCPLFRVHGQFPYREIYNVAPENHPAYKSMLYYDNLRYRMMPYIYSLTAKTYWEDYTIMRALVMDFDKDPSVVNIGNEFMFGPNFLVAPVTEFNVNTKEVYLPSTIGWFDFYTGKYYSGGRNITTDVSLEKIPLFVKEGSIVPFGPELQYTSEKRSDSVTLYVYTGRDAAFTLYEDEGTNYNYEKGKYATIPFFYNEQTKALTIDKRNGEFNDMLKERVFKIVWVDHQKNIAFDMERKPDATVRYKGEKIIIQYK
jgi:alpha-D-xyloside xylohydrolase